MFMILEKKCNNLHVVRQESPEKLAKSDETMNNSTYNGLHLGDTYKQALHQRKIKSQYSTFTHTFKSTSLPHLSLVALWDSLETTWLLTVLPFLRQKFPLSRSYPSVCFLTKQAILFNNLESKNFYPTSLLFCAFFVYVSSFFMQEHTTPTYLSFFT